MRCAYSGRRPAVSAIRLPIIRVQTIPVHARWALLSVGALLAGIGDLSAQTVRGQIVSDQAGGPPVGGAFVSLVDQDGFRVGAAFTEANGFFEVTTPEEGTYRLKVDRIGFEDWLSPPMTLGAGEEQSVRFAVTVVPIRLADINVDVHNQCVTDPENAIEISTVWQEAQKALETAAWAEQGGGYRFDTNTYERTLAKDLEVEQVISRAHSAVARTPFMSLPADELAEKGYLRQREDSYHYFAPDAVVLLSRSFEEDHCFGLIRLELDGRNYLGVSFEPVRGNREPDISGILWLDEQTAEIRNLEFNYVNLPWRVWDHNVGGVVSFQRLPNDAFVVRQWFIRMPELKIRNDQFGRVDVLGYKEDGGELIGVFTPRGDRVDWK